MPTGRPTGEAAKNKHMAMTGLAAEGLSAQQIARLVNISPQAVHKYTRRHQIRTSRVGLSAPFDRKKVDNLVRLFDT